MDATTLNGYVKRAKNIKHAITWANLKAEMLKEGASPDDVLYVSKFLQKGSAKQNSYVSPVKYIDVGARIPICYLFNALPADDGPVFQYDIDSNTLYVNRRYL